MTTILTNILIFIVATIVFVWTSDGTHEFYKLPGLLMPSILSAASLIFTNASSIVCTYTEYRVAAELFANERKEDYGMFCLALVVCIVVCSVTIGIFILKCLQTTMVVYMATKIIYATAFRTETTSSIKKTIWI